MTHVTIERAKFEQVLEALEEIALAGMSGTGQESEEAMTAWHARQAWKFIGIAARALEPIKQARSTPVQEPVAFKIYKPTPPRLAIPNVRDAELPWVYDQDPSSGNVASMWVTPVKATPPAAPKKGQP